MQCLAMDLWALRVCQFWMIKCNFIFLQLLLSRTHFCPCMNCLFGLGFIHTCQHLGYEVQQLGTERWSYKWAERIEMTLHKSHCSVSKMDFFVGTVLPSSALSAKSKKHHQCCLVCVTNIFPQSKREHLNKVSTLHSSMRIIWNYITIKAANLDTAQKKFGGLPVFFSEVFF